MKVLNKILFFPIYLIALFVNLFAEVVKQAFSFVSGLFFLVMLVCLIVTVLNHAWSQCLLLVALIVIGYAGLFGLVAIKVLLEEFKNYCFKKVF